MGFRDLEIEAGGSAYIKTPVGETTIRVVSDAEVFYKNFDAKLTYLTKEAAQKDKDADVRFALWAIDRADGQIKVWEFPASIARSLKDMANSSQFGFEGDFPYDIVITRSGTGLETRYTVTGARKDSELTEVEKAAVAALQPMRMFLRETAADKDQVPSF